MELDFSAEEDLLRRRVREFLAAQLPDKWTGIWHEGIDIFNGRTSVDISFELTKRLADKNWLTRHWPEEYGGTGSSIWEQVVLQEEYDCHFEPRGGQYTGADRIGPAIMLFGSDEQKRRYLPEIASGTVQWAQLFSEPDAGSDLASIRTMAVRDGDNFVVNGEKIWTSYANSANHGFLLARTGTTAQRKTALTVFLIDMPAHGLSVREVDSTLGWHRLHNEVFDNVVVPAAAVLGEVDDGWRVATATLAFERSGIAAYSRASRVLGRIWGDQDEEFSDVAQGEFVDALTMGRLAELINYEMVMNQDETPGWLANALKVIDTWYQRRVAALAERHYGVYARINADDPRAAHNGEIESFVVKRAPTASIAGGTQEIQTGVIARSALGLARGSVRSDRGPVT